MTQPYQIKWFGWRKDRPDHRDKHFRPALSPKRLPAAVDLRDHCPPHMDQGALGSCTANGITGALRYALMKEGYKDTPYSRLQLYFDEREIEGTVKEDSGAEIRDGVKSLAAKGVAPEALWPYNIDRFKQRPSKQVYARAVQFQALEYRKVDVDATAVKSALAEGFPVIVGYNCFDQIDSDSAARTGIIEMPGTHEAPVGGHCTYLCGYGQHSGYFTSRNSWGSDWGDRGDMYLPEAYIEQQGDDFWVLTKASWAPYRKPVEGN